MQANYKGRTIRRTAKGYEVDGLLFKNLTAATDYLDWL